MTRYSSTMTEALQEVREGFSPKQIKMAIGIASDKRYAGGNMTGAVQAIEKIKRGLSDHPQVAAVLKRQNEDLEEELDEGKMKDRLTKAQDLMGPSKNREQGIEFVMKGLKVSKKEATKLVDAVLDMVMNNEVEIDEMKMNDPKLNKIFDKLKRGDTVKLKTSSTISKGTDFVDYVVKAKNTVNKGRVEKITLVTKGNEKAVKKFLYKRDGQVTFAIGDMGASIDDIKEAAHALAEKLKVSDGVGAWIKDFQKSDAPQFQGKSEEDRKKMALAAFADAGGKLEETELTEAKISKELASKILSMNKDKKFVRVSGDFVPEIYLSGFDRDALKKEFGKLPRGLPNATTGVTVVDMINYALGKDRVIDTEDGDSQSPKLISWDRGGKVIGRPKTVGDAAKIAGVRMESVELDEAKYKYDGKVVKISKKEFAKVSKDYKNTTKGKERMMILDPKTQASISVPVQFEEVELDEAVKYQFVAVDRLGKVIGFASDERDAKDMARRGHTMDSPSKGKGVVGRNKAKVVKLKKPMSDKQGDMMINRDFDMNKFGGETTYSVGLKEEDDEKKMDKPDSAKEVDQMRDDKKKTRIAQLQLQIAKATETINKLNTQEKPNA